MGGPVLFDAQRSLVYIRALEWTPYGWGLVKWYAPDVGAIVLIIILILGVTRVRRVLRNRQVPSRWYCSRCNYELTGPDAAGLCPECGIDCAKSRPKRGRSTRRRLVVLALIILPALSACVSGLCWGLQRYEKGGPFNSRPWPTIYMGYLGTNWLFSKPITVGGDGAREWRTNRYIPFHLPGGETAGPELPLVPGDNYGYVLSDDGRWLGTATCVGPDGHGELVVYNTITGSTKRGRLTDEWSPNAFQVAIPFSSDRSFIHTDGAFADGAVSFTPRLFALDLAARDAAMVEAVASVTRPTVPYSGNPGGLIPANTEFAVLREGGVTKWALLSFTFDGNGGLAALPEVTTLDASGTLQTVRLSKPVFPGWHSRLIDHGNTLELEDNHSWLTFQVSLVDGSVTQSDRTYREVMQTSKNGVCCYLDQNGELKVALDGQTPFAALKAPAGRVIPTGVSSDGRWVAAQLLGHAKPAFCPNCVPATRACDILVWDLKDVLPKSVGNPVLSPVPPTPTP
jgi:hypothetical protein